MLIELFYIGMPVVRTDGRTVTWLPKFLGWVDYLIFLGMGLRSLAHASRVELRYHQWDDHYVFGNYSSRWPVLIKTIGHLAFCMKEFTAIQKLLSSSNITST